VKVIAQVVAEIVKVVVYAPMQIAKHAMVLKNKNA
jgi:hypothetical protein